MAALIRIRRDTSNNWASNDPTLAQGELGLDTDTGVIKVGNGSDSWSELLSIGVYNSNDRISKTVDLDTGSLIVDEFGKLYFDRGGTLVFDDTGNLFAGTGNSNFKISLDNHTGDVTEYNFGHDGNLSLPGGATIGDLYGDGFTEISAAADNNGLFLTTNDGVAYIGPQDTGVFIGTDYFGTQHTWNFNSDGVTTFPDGSQIQDLEGFATFGRDNGVGLAADGVSILANPTTGIILNASPNEYLFYANGTVQLPGNVQLSTSSLILGAASSMGTELYIEAIDFATTDQTVIMITSHGFTDGQRVYINNIGSGSTEELNDTYCYVQIIDVDNFKIYSDQNFLFPIWESTYTPFVYSGQQQLNGTVQVVNASGDVVISTSRPDNDHTWSFSADGNLVLPANSYILNSDMTVYGGTGGSSGDRIVNGENSLSINASGDIVLDNSDVHAGNRGIIWNWGNENGGVNAGIRHDEDGITINSFSDGDFYSGGSPVNIVTNPGMDQNQWTFNETGNLVLPANGYVLNSDMTIYGGSGSGSSLPVNNTGWSTILTSSSDGQSVSWSQNSALSFNGYGVGMTGTDCNLTFQHGGSLFAQIDVNANVYNTQSVGNVKITSNKFSGPHDWIFGIDGNLTLPAGGEIHSATGVGNVEVNTNDGNISYTWTFGDNGILTVPAEIMDMSGNNHVNLNDNGGIAIGTFGPNPVGIYTDDGNNYYSWWLDEKGFMSLPDCGSQPPTGTPDAGPAFAQSGGILYWYDGADWRVVNLT